MGTDVAQAVIRETESHRARDYLRRTYHLALAYATLFLGSIGGLGLLLWQAQLYVTLAQRSNVETLTLAFLFIFFGYLAFLSAGGAWGALQIAYYELLARAGAGRVEVERRKARRRRRGALPPAIALNAVLEHAERPHQPFTLAVCDAVGPAGHLVIDGAEIRHVDGLGGGSNSLMAFFVHQVNALLQERGEPGDLDIVAWKQIDDELTEQHLGLVRFARNLERQLGAAELWPKRTLTDDDCRRLERQLAQVCPALRNEALLPDWEYAAQHQLPLIPEPLGLVSLQRTERRVDPLASMGCAVVVVLAALIVLALLIAFPPWVPGK